MIKSICVCGAGTMGSGIAQVAAMGGFQTLLFDVDAAMVQKGRSSIEKNLQILMEKKKISPEDRDTILQRLSFSSTDTDCIADLVIEAIIERQDAKQALLGRLAALNTTDTILASNTSSLSLKTLAGTIPHPDRFIGMHFFNPAPLMKLVEIVETGLTSPSTTEAVMTVTRQMGKTAVLCQDAPGFIVNHVARPYYIEALRLLEEEHTDMETIDTLMENIGFRMGPFRLMDLIGNDINYAVSCSVYEAMGQPQRLKPSPIQEQKVKQGQLGRKTGQGYYRYEAGI